MELRGVGLLDGDANQVVSIAVGVTVNKVEDQKHMALKRFQADMWAIPQAAAAGAEVLKTGPSCGGSSW